MTKPSRRGRILACVLAGAGALVALTYVVANPFTVKGYMERDGEVVLIGSSLRAGALVFIGIQRVAAISALVGLVAAARGRDRVATRSLGVAAATGLIPAVVPGVLALAARQIVRRSARPV